MSKMKEYRQRIKSVKNIQKITKSMQMIAVSKMRKAEKLAKAGKMYNKNIIQLFRLISKDTDLSKHLYFSKRTEGKKLVVVFSPNRGFAGNLLVNEFNTFVTGTKQFNRQELDVIYIGKKLKKYIANKINDVIADFSYIGETPTMQEIKGLSQVILENYVSGKYNEVFILYADYINSLIQIPKIVKLLPATLEDSELAVDNANSNFVFEPERNKILNSLVSLYVDNTLYQFKAETVASEFASRMIAMKNATEKAEDLNYGLNIELNKLRQDIITRELGEITSSTL
jgi:F-type H+-transporting ATPase subunit gamma